MINGNSIVLEYSMSLKSFHRTTVDDMLKHNLQKIGAWQETYYVPIGIFESYEACDAFYKEAEPIIRQLEERPELSLVTIEELLKKFNR